MNSRLPGLLLGAFVFGTAAQAWNLSPCSGIATAQRARYREKVMSARPGASDYVPKPFPKNDADVKADFVYQYRQLQAPREGRVNPLNGNAVALDKNLLALIDGNRLDFEVLPIENWTGRRCLGPRDGDQGFLMRLHDRHSHAEVARVVMQDSGLLDAWAHREPEVHPEWWLIPVQRPAALAAAVSKAVGESLISAQYVETYGTFECMPMLPCVAMRSRATKAVFVADQHGNVVSFGPESRYLSRKRDLEKPRDIAAIKRTLTPSQGLMSLGGDLYVVVERVKK